MTGKFLRKVYREGIVDTRKYRYILRGREIMRIAIDALDTIAALSDKSDINPNGWENKGQIYFF